MKKGRVFKPSKELLNSIRLYRALLLLCEVPEERISVCIKLFMHSPTRKNGHALQFTDQELRTTIVASANMSLSYNFRK